MGWNRAVQAAKSFDTWVICEERWCAPEIQPYIAAHGPIPGLEFVFVPKSRVAELIAKVPGFFYLSYNFWHRGAFEAALALHHQLRFDVAHQVNYCGYREPGYLWKLDVPFIWGPIGGTQNYPWRFLLEAGVVGAVREAARSVLNFLQLRLSPRVRRATHKASVLLAANSTNQRDFARVHGVATPLLLETGLSQVAAAPRAVDTRTQDARGPFRVLWSGDLEPHKGLPLLLKALARLQSAVPFQLRVLGRGRARARWERLARRLGIAERIAWMGWVPHEQAMKQYAGVDVLVFTSLRDTSGNALLEALGAGVPVVCLAHQGAGDIVTDECGIRIPVTTPREVVAMLSEALARLARDPALCQRLSAGAIERARHYLWTENGETMTALYQGAIQRAAAAAAAVATMSGL